MKQFSYVLTKPHGLHIRPMDGLMKEASRYASRISLCNGERSTELGRGRLLSALNAPCGSQVTVIVEGMDEEAAVAAMQHYFVANM